MGGINNWNVKPDRKADAHPHETYDAISDRYYYDPNKKEKNFVPKVNVECDTTPTPTEEFAEVIREIIRIKYPDLEPEGDVPIAVRMSVYPAHIYAGGLQPYVMGESIVEWEKWLYEALNGVVWESEKQICVTGTDIRHRAYSGIKINVYKIYEQKKNNGR